MTEFHGARLVTSDQIRKHYGANDGRTYMIARLTDSHNNPNPVNANWVDRLLAARPNLTHDEHILAVDLYRIIRPCTDSVRKICELLDYEAETR